MEASFPFFTLQPLMKLFPTHIREGANCGALFSLLKATQDFCAGPKEAVLLHLRRLERNAQSEEQRVSVLKDSVKELICEIELSF